MSDDLQIQEEKPQPEEQQCVEAVTYYKLLFKSDIGGKPSKSRLLSERAWRIQDFLNLNKISLVDAAESVEMAKDTVKDALYRAQRGTYLVKVPKTEAEIKNNNSILQGTKINSDEGKSVIEALERKYELNQKHEASLRLNKYAWEDVYNLEGLYMMIRPDMKSDGNIVTCPMPVIWQHGCLRYCHAPVRDGYRWQVGGILARHWTPNLFYFLETHNDHGRFPTLTMHFNEDDKSFVGAMLGPSGPAYIAAVCPVLLRRWPANTTNQKFDQKVSIIEKGQDQYEEYKEQLNAAMTHNQDTMLFRVKV